MSRTEMLREVRMKRFEEVYDRWRRRRITQALAANVLGRDGSDVPALGGSVGGGRPRSPEGQAGGGTGSSPGASRGGGGAGCAVPGRVQGLERAALP